MAENTESHVGHLKSFYQSTNVSLDVYASSLEGTTFSTSTVYHSASPSTFSDPHDFDQSLKVPKNRKSTTREASASFKSEHGFTSQDLQQASLIHENRECLYQKVVSEFEATCRQQTTASSHPPTPFTPSTITPRARTNSQKSVETSDDTVPDCQASISAASDATIELPRLPEHELTRQRRSARLSEWCHSIAIRFSPKKAVRVPTPVKTIQPPSGLTQPSHETDIFVPTGERGGLCVYVVTMENTPLAAKGLAQTAILGTYASAASANTAMMRLMDVIGRNLCWQYHRGGAYRNYWYNLNFETHMLTRISMCQQEIMGERTLRTNLHSARFSGSTDTVSLSSYEGY